MKSCLVARLGVIGDQLVAASVLPHLKAQGYHITFMAYAPFAQIHQNNPYIDYLRELPMNALGEANDFMEVWKQAPKFFDRVIHLSETMERTLVYFEDQAQFWWDDVARRALSAHSYIERTHDLAGVPREFGNHLFFPSTEEERQAKASADGWRADGGPLIALSVAGSNFDKIYPKLPQLAARVMQTYPKAHLILYAGANDRDRDLVEKILKALRDASADAVKRTNHTLGWSIRKSLAMAQQLDVVIGPDTGLMWAVGFARQVAKILLLSHASPLNISTHWVNATTLHAKQADVPCWPCHRLHRRPETCRIEAETKTAKCISSISLDQIMEAVAVHLDRKE